MLMAKLTSRWSHARGGRHREGSALKTSSPTGCIQLGWHVEAKRPAFPLVRDRSCGGLVGLAGLEPAASSLSGIDGQALCYPAFPQFALVR
jgi:hypothetical protein